MIVTDLDVHDLTGYIIAACFAVFVLVWLVAAFFTKRTVQRSGWSWRFVFLFLWFVGYLMSRHDSPIASFVHRTLWDRTPALDVVADALAIAGLIVMLWARVTIGSNWSGSVVLKENHELITRGPYAYVRHPIYTGLLMMVLGTVLYFGQVAGLLWLAIGCVAFFVKVRSEEQLMTRTFPDQYPEYRKRVKAIVPFVL